MPMLKPLTGVRVLDFSKVLAGPLCAQYLGDLGADVVKVEPCEGGDDTRAWPPFRGDTGAVFLSVNRNKRSLAIDLKTDAGRDIARTLARTADVVIESYGTGVVERLGIDFASLKGDRDNLIYCSISGFGRTGPLKDNLGYDVVLQAFSGIMSLTGEKGGGPVRSPFSPIDQATGMHALSGILAALLERNRTGKGCYLEVSLFETAVAFLGYNFQTFWEKGTLPEKAGSGYESLCPYQAFDASDGLLLLGIANDNLWRRFCGAIDRKELATDPRFATNRARVANFAETVGIVQAIIATRARDHWVELLTKLKVPCAPINTLTDVLDHPHTGARGIIADYQHPELGALRTVMQPVVFDGAKRTVASPPPLHGKHSREILREIGYTAETIDGLAQAGTIVVRD
jgi:crotonobetainyl-CoA:carnitine CoA-transferase CaiB-like acyl-CoA transferase